MNFLRRNCTAAVSRDGDGVAGSASVLHESAPNKALERTVTDLWQAHRACATHRAFAALDGAASGRST